MKKTYTVKEVFYSIQGEGHRVGTPSVFVRFAGCNLQCTVKKEGFNCDTDFASGDKMTADELLRLIKETDKGNCHKIILTGGEPTLQIDRDLLELLKAAEYYLALETNGTKLFPENLINWISCSPKPGTKPAIRQVDELRCVIKPGVAPQTMGITAMHYFVSPAADAPVVSMIPKWKASASDLNKSSMDWAVKWCLENPKWRLSFQTHKILNVR